MKASRAIDSPITCSDERDLMTCTIAVCTSSIEYLAAIRIAWIYVEMGMRRKLSRSLCLVSRMKRNRKYMPLRWVENPHKCLPLLKAVSRQKNRLVVCLPFDILGLWQAKHACKDARVTAGEHSLIDSE